MDIDTVFTYTLRHRCQSFKRPSYATKVETNSRSALLKEHCRYWQALSEASVQHKTLEVRCYGVVGYWGDIIELVVVFFGCSWGRRAIETKISDPNPNHSHDTNPYTNTNLYLNPITLCWTTRFKTENHQEGIISMFLVWMLAIRTCWAVKKTPKLLFGIFILKFGTLWKKT